MSIPRAGVRLPESGVARCGLGAEGLNASTALTSVEAPR